MSKGTKPALSEYRGQSLLLGHLANGSGAFHVPGGYPKDNSKALHHKTLQAMELWFMEDSVF